MWGWTAKSVCQLMWSEVPQGSIFGPLLLILCTSELLDIVVNHNVGYADNTTIYAFIPKPFSRPQVMK